MHVSKVFFFYAVGAWQLNSIPPFPSLSLTQSPKEVLGSKVDPQIQDNVTRTPSE